MATDFIIITCVKYLLLKDSIELRYSRNSAGHSASYKKGAYCRGDSCDIDVLLTVTAMDLQCACFPAVPARSPNHPSHLLLVGPRFKYYHSPTSEADVKTSAV